MLQAEYDALPRPVDMTLKQLRDEFIALSPRLARVTTRRRALRDAMVKREAKIKAKASVDRLTADEKAALLDALNGATP